MLNQKVARQNSKIENMKDLLKNLEKNKFVSKEIVNALQVSV